MQELCESRTGGIAMKTYYHFTGTKLRDGRPVPAIGEWLTYEGKVQMCESGLHASADPFDALQYAPGALLHKVVLKSIVEKQDDKVVARSRKIIATINVTELLRKFARLQALGVIHLWDAPTVVKEYLTTGDENLRAAEAARAAVWAAWAAAWAAEVAAWEAAWAAAEAAAGAAAEAAAGAAARDAAWDAAWAAARAATRKQFNRSEEHTSELQSLRH